MPCIGMIQWKIHKNHCGTTVSSTKPALFTGSFHDSDTALLAQVRQPSNSSMSFGELPHTRIQGEASRCSAPSPSTFVRVPYFRFSPPCQTSRFPWSSCSAPRSPPAPNSFSTTCASCPASFIPSPSTASGPWGSTQISALTSTASRRTGMSTRRSSSRSSSTNSSRPQDPSIAKYLRRRARKIDVEPFGQEVAEIVKKHFKELRSAAIGPFIRDVEPYRVVQLY